MEAEGISTLESKYATRGGGLILISRAMRLFILTSTLLLVLLGFGVLAFAGAAVDNCSSDPCVTGYKWSSWPVRYYMDFTIPTGWYTSIVNADSSWDNAGTSFRFSRSIDSQVPNNVGKYSFFENFLAITYTYLSGNTITEADTTFNGKWSWATNGDLNAYDVETTAVHEFGHWLRLDGQQLHRADVMYYAKDLGELRRSLSTHDIQGIRAIYP